MHTQTHTHRHMLTCPSMRAADHKLKWEWIGVQFTATAESVQCAHARKSRNFTIPIRIFSRKWYKHSRYRRMIEQWTVDVHVYSTLIRPVHWRPSPSAIVYPSSCSHHLYTLSIFLIYYFVSCIQCYYHSACAAVPPATGQVVIHTTNKLRNLSKLPLTYASRRKILKRTALCNATRIEYDWKKSRVFHFYRYEKKNSAAYVWAYSSPSLALVRAAYGMRTNACWRNTHVKHRTLLAYVCVRCK